MKKKPDAPKKYSVEFAKKAVKALSKLDKPTKALLYSWIKQNLDGCTNPRFTGKPLSGNFKGAWRYRVGDYRIIADIRDDTLIILIVNIGHRREIYK